MDEIWKDIAGFEGVYQVSNTGKVRSLSRKDEFFNRFKLCVRLKKGKTLGTYDGNGYDIVKLRLNRTPKMFSVHRLVAIAFIRNTENKPCVNHINGIKNDNRVENLEWCTHKENIQHAHDTGLAINKGLKGKLNGMYGRTYGDNPRAKIVLDLNTGVFFSCAKEAADAYGINKGCLQAMLRGVYKNKTNLIYA